MRHIVITIIILWAASPAIAQRSISDPLYDVPARVITDSSITITLNNTLDDQLLYTQYYLQKYHKERQVAYGIAATGVVLGSIGVAALQQESDYGKYFLYGGAACTVVSAFIFYDAEKWLKKASVRIDLTGVRITF